MHQTPETKINKSAAHHRGSNHRRSLAVPTSCLHPLSRAGGKHSLCGGNSSVVPLLLAFAPSLVASEVGGIGEGVPASTGIELYVRIHAESQLAS
jgi:hypothetical protein